MDVFKETASVIFNGVEFNDSLYDFLITNINIHLINKGVSFSEELLENNKLSIIAREYLIS
jgi:hypothetical protein